MLIVAAKMKKGGVRVKFIRDNTNLIRNLNDEREIIPGRRPGKLQMEVTRNKYSVFKASTADPTMVKAVKMETDYIGALGVTVEKCQFLSSCEESISSTLPQLA